MFSQEMGKDCNPVNGLSSSSETSKAISLFPPPEEAFFISRPNRFLVYCRQGEKVLTAHLPNPGRLRELLLPGCRLLLIPGKGKHRKNPYTVAAVEKAGRTIMLDTLRTNTAARALLERNKIHALERAMILRPEVRCGRSRFDFLLNQNGQELYLEVKSCTLMGENVAMFPDAVTIRGTRHLIELAQLQKRGEKVAVLFLVHSPHVRYFMPDYHTDLRFAQTFLALRDHIRFLPVAVKWERDLSLCPETYALSVPWSYLEHEVQDRGSYLLILRLEKNQQICIGKWGSFFFQAGYYVYVGSAMAHLSRRLERHRHGGKQYHWHIDYLRGVSQFHAALPIRASVRLECSLAEALFPLAHWIVDGFGCSDCFCQSHLFGFEINPLQLPAFQDLLLYFRIDRFRGEEDYV